MKVEYRVMWRRASNAHSKSRYFQQKSAAEDLVRFLTRPNAAFRYFNEEEGKHEFEPVPPVVEIVIEQREVSPWQPYPEYPANDFGPAYHIRESIAAWKHE